MNTLHPSAVSNPRCACRAAISSRAVRVSRLALYQPPTSTSSNRASSAVSVCGSRGNLPPSSMPVKPMSRASASTRSSGVSPTSSGMSSLIHAIGLTPKRILTLVSPGPFFESIDIRRPCHAYLGTRRDFGYCDIPPCAPGLGRRHGVGLDDADAGARGNLRAALCLLEFREGGDVFSDGAETGGMSCEVDLR